MGLCPRCQGLAWTCFVGCLPADLLAWAAALQLGPPGIPLQSWCAAWHQPWCASPCGPSPSPWPSPVRRSGCAISQQQARSTCPQRQAAARSRSCGHLPRTPPPEAAAATPAQQRRQCAACGAAAGKGVKLRKCARCRQVRYCSPACQAADWARHRAECSSGAAEQAVGSRP